MISHNQRQPNSGQTRTPMLTHQRPCPVASAAARRQARLRRDGRDGPLLRGPGSTEGKPVRRSSAAPVENVRHISGPHGHMVLVGEVQAMGEFTGNCIEETSASRTSGRECTCDLSKSKGERGRRPLDEQPGYASTNRQVAPIVVTLCGGLDCRGEHASVPSDERSQDLEDHTSIHVFES